MNESDPSIESLLESIENDDEPPAGLSPALCSLWHTKKGHWEKAHDIAQDIDTPWGSWMHAHLHVIEGDLGNAGYWYRRAGKPDRRGENLEEEWRELVEAVLAGGG